MNVLAWSFLVLVFFSFCTNHASLEIVAGWFHNCVYEPGQTGMLCWGRNSVGQLGYEDANNRGDDAGEMSANLPIVNLGPDFVVHTTSLGGRHSCAASQEHAVKCWGDGLYYQTGHATNNGLGGGAGEMGANLAFVEFRADFVPLKVAAGRWHSCVLSTDALFVCFGDNAYGQCGAGTSDLYITGPPSSIADVDLGSNFTPIDIAAFYLHVCALSQQQSIKCFGYNLSGQLGYGDTTHRGLTPQSMGDGLAVLSLGSSFTPKAVATGGWHTCALSTLKTVKCFGYNADGQCGQVTPGGTSDAIGDAANEMDDNLPAIVFPDGFVPMQMALGYKHTCILSESAQIVCFGYNWYGQLGLGHTSSTTSPTLVDLGTGFIPRKLTAGYDHSCAVSTVDTVKCWGRNDHGQLGLGYANNMGDGLNEMGDDLPIVDLQYTTATENPTTSTPTTAAPTTAAPTTAAPTTAAPTTAAPTTAAPTTAAPTTTAPTTDETTDAPNNSSNSNHTVTVTIRTDSLSSTQVLVAIANAHNLSWTLLTITTLSSEDDSDDGFATVELLVAVASNVELDYDVIEATLREAMVDEYGEDVQVDIDVHGDDDEDEGDAESFNFLDWRLTVALCIASVCFCFAVAGIKCILGKRRQHTIDNTQIELPERPRPLPAAVVMPNVHGVHAGSEAEEKKEDVHPDVNPGAGGEPDLELEQSVGNRDEGRRASVAAQTAAVTAGMAADEFESSDSSIAMHDDHWAVLKVTNYAGVDEAQKLEIFDKKQVIDAHDTDAEPTPAGMEDDDGSNQVAAGHTRSE